MFVSHSTINLNNCIPGPYIFASRLSSLCFIFSPRNKPNV